MHWVRRWAFLASKQHRYVCLFVHNCCWHRAQCRAASCVSQKKINLEEGCKRHSKLAVCVAHSASSIRSCMFCSYLLPCWLSVMLHLWPGYCIVVVG